MYLKILVQFSTVGDAMFKNALDITKFPVCFNGRTPEQRIKLILIYFLICINTPKMIHQYISIHIRRIHK